MSTLKITGYGWNNGFGKVKDTHSPKPRKVAYSYEGKRVEKWCRGLMGIDKAMGYFMKPFVEDKKKFVVLQNIAKNWEQIVGKKYAEFCTPKVIGPGKMTIAVHNAAVGFILKNNQELILERINQLYGFKSISKIVMKQEPKDIAERKIEEIKIAPEDEEKISVQLANIENKELSSTLKKVWEMVYQKKN